MRPRIVAVVGVLLVAGVGTAQNVSERDPLPRGTTGKVLPLHGTVTEIKGLSANVAGKSDAVNAALKDLGATTTANEIHIQLSSDVLFDFDKAEILPKAVPALQRVATVLKSYPGASCSIEGHTDNLGNEQYNQKLSERRADSVKKWLAANGVSTSMTTRGFGKTRPIAPNALPNGKDNPEGRQKNRRVEIVVKKS